MKEIFCGRCGGVFSIDKEEELLSRPITLRLAETIQSLCPNCYNQLKSWFYDMKNVED